MIYSIFLNLITIHFNFRQFVQFKLGGKNRTMRTEYRKKVSLSLLPDTFCLCTFPLYFFSFFFADSILFCHARCELNERFISMKNKKKIGHFQYYLAFFSLAHSLSSNWIMWKSRDVKALQIVLECKCCS
jgi:hypothetical protein